MEKFKGWAHTANKELVTDRKPLEEVAVVFLATLAPAVRAQRVDPMAALRYE